MGSHQSIIVRIFLATSLGMTLAAAQASGGNVPCIGDCNGDKSVNVAELVRMVNIALGRQSVSTCEAGDANSSGTIEINELIIAVRRALDGCSGDVQPQPFKHTIDHPSDTYLAFSPSFDGPSWVKFSIKVSDPTRVYYQNSRDVPLHYDFISTTLSPYIGWTPSEIDAVSLFAEGQELVLGAVLYSPMAPREIAIQLVRQDPYTVDEVTTYFEAVRASINAAQGVPYFYFPSFEQQASATENEAQLQERGIPLGTTARWQRGNVCYAAGWAYGRIVRLDGNEIENAYEDGTLRPQDILLTDGVPSEIPFVAGVLTLTPTTPNSHVAILAADWGSPLAFLSQENTAALAESLVGREVVLRATPLQPRIFTGFDVDPTVCQIDLVDVTDTLEPELETLLRDLKRAPDLDIRPVVLAGSYTADVDSATPDDIVRIGGKAANYGFLRRNIADATRPAIAITFDLWNEYLDQTLTSGQTLRTEIAERLAPFTTYPPSDFKELYSALKQIRDLIDNEADFDSTQRDAVIAALQPFDANRRIRFRSSTNVEDSDVFTGAGLYESHSGCVADDTDADEAGPSHCDPTRDNERGVFRALRKVFESFYNDNAFVERLRHRIDEDTVGMAVLVHHSFPDETELANGVATLSTLSLPSANITIVSQPGAESVTNPEGGQPEVVDVFVGGSNIFPNLRQTSELLPLGSTVMRLPDDYRELATLLLAVANAFADFHQERAFELEFEFVKTVDEGLIVKQIRRVPRNAGGSNQGPILIHRPIELCTFQGEYGDAFANYRLKTRWQPIFAGGEISETSGTIFAEAPHNYVADGAVQTLTGSPSEWNDSQHGTFDPQREGIIGLTDSWTVGSGDSRRTQTLKSYVPVDVGPARLPIIFPSDLSFILEGNYTSAVPYRGFDPGPRLRTTEDIRLHPCLDSVPVGARHIRIERSYSGIGGVTVDTRFYWPPFPVGAVAGYTAPLDRWLQTALTGVTDTALVVSGYFSQTYRPEHHNFSENYIFDPHLEPDIDAALLAEWDSLGIQALVVPQTFDDPSAMEALTTDGRLVELETLRGR